MTTAPVIHITGITNVLNYVAHAVLYNCMYMLECVCGTCAPKWQNRSKEERKKRAICSCMPGFYQLLHTEKVGSLQYLDSGLDWTMDWTIMDSQLF